MTGIGPIVTVGAVRRAVETTLQEWLPSVLAAAARAEGRDPDDPEQHQPIRSWRRLPDIRTAHDDQLPSVSVASGGLAEEAEDQGDGTYRAVWGIVVSVHVRGNDHEDTADRVGYYAAAIRTALAQHGDLGGVAASTVWLAEDYALSEPNATRNLGGGFVEFTVAIEGVLDIYAGPAEPPLDPSTPNPDLPEVEDTTVIEHHLD